MSLRLIRTTGFAALALCAASILSAVALGRARAQAELRIPSGSAKVVASGDGAPPVVSGSFTVVNAGSLSARTLQVRLELVAPRHTVVLHRYVAGPLEAGARTSLKPRVAVPRSVAKLDWSIEACAVLGTNPKATPAANGCRRLGTDNLAASVTSPTVSPTTTTTTGTPPTTSTSTSASTTTTAVTPTTTATVPTVTRPAGPPINPPPVT